MRYFETSFLAEAEAFMAGLDHKTIKKYSIILTLQNKPMVQNFLKNFKTTFGNSAQNMQDFKSDFWRSGIRPITKEH
jgi:hypothetical protein